MAARRAESRLEYAPFKGLPRPVMMAAIWGRTKMSDNSVQGLDATPIRLPPGVGRADSELRRLTIAGKPFYLLRQRGSFADIAYDHGRLLADVIEQGVFPEILSAIARGTDLGSHLRSSVAA